MLPTWQPQGVLLCSAGFWKEVCVRRRLSGPAVRGRGTGSSLQRPQRQLLSVAQLGAESCGPAHRTGTSREGATYTMMIPVILVSRAGEFLHTFQGGLAFFNLLSSTSLCKYTQLPSGREVLPGRPSAKHFIHIVF